MMQLNVLVCLMQLSRAIHFSLFLFFFIYFLQIFYFFIDVLVFINYFLVFHLIIICIFFNVI